jgi:hypothetical protein
MMYTSRLLNIAKHNYDTIKREALVMVFVLHKFRHYLLGNKFVFYVDHYGIGLFSQQTTCFQGE